ncbi:helix-turn-helix domain-containing protein [Sphingomonas sp. LB-2]|uniref:winged helix-turn-helix domain-containing protein n=1 Tax=Sphingomonas caeni TaxID=2984949 RepID=UPI0022329085|nr:helix-turn-helix domain-containing protein [Sphingomonas caeni]MCW3847145.1 helix-turn-helix domain-containing protein [Sphingomonas caeni]
MSETDDLFLIETPLQLKALSDPLRQRMLAAFAEPRTVKAAAAHLGEPVTKLYRHVDQLEAAGLIACVAETRRRAVIERTFQAAGRRFAVGRGALPDGSVEDARAAVVARAMQDALGHAGKADGSLRLANLSARLSPESVERIEAELGRLARELNDPAAAEVRLLLLSARGES